MAYELDFQHVQTNGITLHVAQCGPSDGPLVLLLHGFPEFWYGWRHQIEVLAAAGFRVWAPDQRGYNFSDKPTRIADYQMSKLGADILGLMDAAGHQKAAIIGHDWGAAVTWWLAANHPERLTRAVVLNVPHPAVLGQALRRTPRQLLKSWYIFFFQLPWLPEKMFRRRQYRFGRGALRGTSRKGTFTTADLQHYVQAWSQPGALTGMINWYRAAVRTPRKTGQVGKITLPLRILWGRKDAFLEPELAQLSLEYCTQAELTYFDEATHWLHQEESERVNHLLLEFLGPASITTS
ncbi:epoxide hydrolase EphM [Hymenobacter seoulensis]